MLNLATDMKISLTNKDKIIQGLVWLLLKLIQNFMISKSKKKSGVEFVSGLNQQ